MNVWALAKRIMVDGHSICLVIMPIQNQKCHKSNTTNGTTNNMDQKNHARIYTGEH
jgi:hypothetical protein